MTTPDVLTSVARIVVALSQGYEIDAVVVDLRAVVSAYNESDQGAIMPWSAYAFDGDRALAMRAFLARAGAAIVDADGRVTG